MTMQEGEPDATASGEKSAPSPMMIAVMRGVCDDVLDGSLFDESADPGEVMALARQLADQYLRLADAFDSGSRDGSDG